ncbi:MAG TPA: hypothetical protein VD994_11125, partial [Prosthecobacter sp.]|nr:hypothetical protein [Prosthecobacter sp.]
CWLAYFRWWWVGNVAVRCDCSAARVHALRRATISPDTGWANCVVDLLSRAVKVVVGEFSFPRCKGHSRFLAALGMTTSGMKREKKTRREAARFHC